MKRKSILIVLSVILMTVAIGLTACGEKHTHTYDKQVAEAEYLATSATCTQKATYYYSCECGQRGTETFEYGIPLGHNFTNYVSDNNATCTEDGTKTAKCDRCNETDTITDENSALGHSFTNYVPDGNATHAQDGTKTARCDREGCSATDTVIDEGSHNRHTYSSEWTTDENYHWHVATCEHKDEIDGKSMHTASDWIIDVEATYEHAGQRHKECTVCKRILQQEKIDQLISVGISFRTFEVSGKTVYGSVKNSVNEFNFKEEVITGENSSYYVSLDKYGSNLILTKVAPLEIGDNTFYILASVNGEIVDTFVVTIRRRPIYTVVFDSNGATFVNRLQIEEGSFVPEPTAPEKTGYTFTGWDYDFTKVITQDTTITAGWSANTDTKYKVEYYWENIEDDSYTLYETVNLQGTTDTTVVAEQKTYEHFTFNEKSGVLNGNIAGNGSLILKVYYTRDKYALSNENTKYGEITNATSIKYGTLVRTEATEYLGCEFLGWYNGEELLSIDKNYTFNIDKDITAKFKAKDENSNLIFSYGKTFCGITGVKDNTVTQIIIPDYVTSIGDYAFEGCKYIANIHISSIESWCKITGLDNLMRYGGSSNKKLYINGEEITELIIPGSITSIGSYAFYNCTGLTSVAIFDGTTRIDLFSFENCSSLTTVIVPDTLIDIYSSSFKNCDKLKYNEYDNAYYLGSSNNPYHVLMKAKNEEIVSCKINDATKVIAGVAFADCKELINMTIPDSVTSVGDSAFWNCTGLTSVTIPDSVTSVGDSVFCGCSGLTSITIPDSVTSIGSSAFCKCSGLTSITIPDSVTSVGSFAFRNCSGLTSITIPDSVTSIRSSAFRNCSGLTSITVDKANTVYYSENNCIIEKATKKLILGCKTSVIPNDIMSIGDYAFSGCNGLTSVTIPDSVTSIGNDAFYGCTGLTSVTIGNSVTRIGAFAFGGCTGLTSVTYKGTIAEWENITKGYDWRYNVPSSCVIHCTDGDIKIFF